MNISGAGIVKHSKNKENAIKLIEFLTSVEAQQQYAEANYEYPVNPKVEPSALLKSWGSFKEDQLNLEEIGKLQKQAISTFEAAGWD